VTTEAPGTGYLAFDERQQAGVDRSASVVGMPCGERCVTSASH